MAGKADSSDLKIVAAEVVPKADIMQTIAGQMKPLLLALSSLEKVVQLRDARQEPPVVYQPSSQQW